MKPFLLFALSLLLLASACAPKTSETDGQPSYPNSYPSYPSGSNEVIQPPQAIEPPYNPSGKPVQTYLPPAQPVDPNNPYAPLPGDAKLQNGPAYLENHELQTISTLPPEYLLMLKGSLPTPCHALRVNIAISEQTNTIAIEVYSVTDPNALCTQVLQPFEAEVPIRNLIPVRYKVLLNGEEIGEIDG